MSGQATREIQFIGTAASLLNGRRNLDCSDASDDTCTGGMALVEAYSRNTFEEGSFLIVPSLERSGPFVQMHPMRKAVNRRILRDFLGFPFFLAPPSIFTTDDPDISLLRTEQWPIVLTNIAIPPSSGWHPFVRHIFFDESTRLAVFAVINDGATYGTDQIQSTFGALRYIESRNRHCQGRETEFSLYENYVEPPVISQPCWIPVLIYSDDVSAHWDRLISAMLQEWRGTQPVLIIETQSHADEIYSKPQKIANSSIWLTSYRWSPRNLDQLTLQVEGPEIMNVTRSSSAFANLTMAMSFDPTYQDNVRQIHQLGLEADGENPVVGQSEAMPVTREGNLRPCHAGECPMGNLFADAARMWGNKTDIAFITSGGIRGPGWPAGNVTVLDLWQALPFANTLCRGRMSGISLFKLVRYSIGRASFLDTPTETGSDLLQVSGMQVTFNSKLSGSDRLVAVDIWNEEEGNYVPIQRLTMYSFTSDSFLCENQGQFPSLLTNFTIGGEQPGVDNGVSHHDAVAEFLRSQPVAFNTSLQGRLSENQNISIPLNVLSGGGSCPDGTYFDGSACIFCPRTDYVGFVQERYPIEAISLVDLMVNGSATLRNRSPRPISVSLTPSPAWVSLYGFLEQSNVTANNIGGAMLIDPGANATMLFSVNISALEPGTAVGDVRFRLEDGTLLACDNTETAFEVFVRVSPPPQLNQLNEIRYLGFAFAALVILLALGCWMWVHRNRKVQILRSRQPLFLKSLCIGVLLIGSTLIPLSLDDSLVSQEGLDIACMSTIWLGSFGLVITFSALFSKLWRINKLFNSGLVRQSITEHDVLGPFTVLFLSNLILLLVLIIDPLQWTREPIGEEPWNTYGRCRVQGKTGRITSTLIGFVNLGAFLLACWQSFKARRIDDQFSESKNLASAVFSWAQLVLVGVPVLFLVDRGNPTARFCLLASIIFVACLSMLLFIFVPIYTQLRNYQNLEPAARRMSTMSKVRVSGVYASGHRDDSSSGVVDHGQDSTSGNVGRSINGLDASIRQVIAEEEDVKDESSSSSVNHDNIANPVHPINPKATQDDDLHSNLEEQSQSSKD